MSEKRHSRADWGSPRPRVPVVQPRLSARRAASYTMRWDTAVDCGRRLASIAAANVSANCKCSKRQNVGAAAARAAWMLRDVRITGPMEPRGSAGQAGKRSSKPTASKCVCCTSEVCPAAQGQYGLQADMRQRRTARLLSSGWPVAPGPIADIRSTPECRGAPS